LLGQAQLAERNPAASFLQLHLPAERRKPSTWARLKIDVELSRSRCYYKNVIPSKTLGIEGGWL
jgi:hypothetical protein